MNRNIYCIAYSVLTNNAQKMKFSIKGFFSKCDQIRVDLVTFTEEIFNGKLYFLCSENQ